MEEESVYKCDMAQFLPEMKVKKNDSENKREANDDSSKS